MKTKSSTMDPVKEAVALVKFANRGETEVNWGQLITAVQWETARLAYFQKKPAEFWQRFESDSRTEAVPREHVAFRHLKRNKFPKRWESLSEREKVAIAEQLFGNQTDTAKFLSGFDAYIEAREFTQWWEKANAASPADTVVEESLAPKHFVTADGGAVVLLRIYPGSSDKMVADFVTKELKRLGIAQKERKNGKWIEYQKTILKGLAGLWLEMAGKRKPERNAIVFPSRSKGHDHLNKAEERARTSLKTLVCSLENLSTLGHLKNLQQRNYKIGNHPQ